MLTYNVNRLRLKSSGKHPLLIHYQYIFWSFKSSSVLFCIVFLFFFLRKRIISAIIILFHFTHYD